MWVQKEERNVSTETHLSLFQHKKSLSPKEELSAITIYHGFATKYGCTL